jgi:hypothetical protein
VIEGAGPFATAKPDARLVKLLIRARRFNVVVTQGEGTAFAALAQREGVSPSYFTRLVRLSYLAPDIAQDVSRARTRLDSEFGEPLSSANRRFGMSWFGTSCHGARRRHNEGGLHRRALE